MTDIMVRNYKRKTNRATYTKESLEKALEEIIKGVPIKKVSKQHMISAHYHYSNPQTAQLRNFNIKR